MEETIVPFLDLSAITSRPQPTPQPELTLDLTKVGRPSTMVEPTIASGYLKVEQSLERSAPSNLTSGTEPKPTIDSALASILSSIKTIAPEVKSNIESQIASPISRSLTSEQTIQNTQNIFNSDQFLNSLTQTFNSLKSEQSTGFNSINLTEGSTQSELSNRVSNLLNSSIIGITQQLGNKAVESMELGESRATALPIIESAPATTVAISQGRDLINTITELGSKETRSIFGMGQNDLTSAKLDLNPAIGQVESFGQAVKTSLPMTQAVKEPVVPGNFLEGLNEMIANQQRVVESINNQTIINQAASPAGQTIQLTGGPSVKKEEESTRPTNNIMVGQGGEGAGIASLLSVLNKIHATLSSPLRIKA